MRESRSPMAPLTYDAVKSLISQNSRTNSYSNECVIAVCWKESSFRPDATNPHSTSKGLMQMTEPAIDTVNANTPVGVHYNYDDMFDPAKAIQCGTYYLELQFGLAGGITGGLNAFGGRPDYATNVLAAEACLKAGPAGGDPMVCLHQIHPIVATAARPD